MRSRINTAPVLLQLALPILMVFSLAACTPRVELAPPNEPVTINLNVKIDHEVRVKVDRDLDELFDDKKNLF
ncbi:MAG: YnbE family lipoprotein [Deltaproteobacteria bacterium]|nr:YnbE family lipoprotein [Deltaproteobacteria bacterium]